MLEDEDGGSDGPSKKDLQALKRAEKDLMATAKKDAEKAKNVGGDPEQIEFLDSLLKR